MIAAFYTLIRRTDNAGSYAAREPSHRGKVKSYTKPQFARSARSQTDTPWVYKILETVIYADGGVFTKWLDD